MTDYTAKEAAPLLGISPSSVRAFIKRGMIAATKRGRDWLITQEEIDRYNRERRRAGRPLEQIKAEIHAEFAKPRHIKIHRAE